MMKKYKYLSAFLFVGFLSLAQEKDSLKEIKTKDKIVGLNVVSHHQYSMNDKTPKIFYPDLNKTEYHDVFLNGSPANFETIRAINPQNIEHIEIVKSNDLHSNSEKKSLIIKTKTKVISMSDFIKKYSIKTGKRVLISIDGEMINESFENLFLDESFIMQIKIFNLDKIEKDDAFTYLKILTRTAENVRKANEILIR